MIGLAGRRRAGKTFLSFETIQRLVARGVGRPRLIYLNLEDDRLQPLRAENLDLILRCHRELFPATIGARCYLFLDEVQNVPGWERWVRRLNDTEDIEVFVTGSSSHLLTRDLATVRRGRSIPFEVFPLSFAEVLEFRGIGWQPSHPDSESVVRGAFEDYLRGSGFPELVLAGDTKRFWNSCWSLTDPATVAREQAAMALGNSRAKTATGLLLYHECAPALTSTLPPAHPARR